MFRFRFAIGVVLVGLVVVLLPGQASALLSPHHCRASAVRLEGTAAFELTVANPTGVDCPTVSKTTPNTIPLFGPSSPVPFGSIAALHAETGSGVASASVADLTAPHVKITGMSATATAHCGSHGLGVSVSGESSIAYIKVGGNEYSNVTGPMTIPISGSDVNGVLYLNQQIVENSPSGPTLTQRAVRGEFDIKVSDDLTVTVYLTLAEAVSGCTFP